MDLNELFKSGVYHGHINAGKPKNSIKLMLQSLMPSEKVLYITPCRFNGLRGALTLTDKQLIFTSRIFFFPGTIKSILFKDMAGVSFVKELKAELIIETPAETIRFEQIGKRSIGNELVLRINEQRLNTDSSTQTTQQINTQPAANIEDLEYLASLKDKGIITQEEFDLKKKQLLGL